MSPPLTNPLPKVEHLPAKPYLGAAIMLLAVSLVLMRRIGRGK